MKVEPGGVEGVELIGPDAAEFGSAIESLLGRKPDEVLKPALRYSVIARNNDLRAVALLGVGLDIGRLEREDGIRNRFIVRGHAALSGKGGF